MKKILSTICVLAFCIQSTVAEYTLTPKDDAFIDQAIVLINNLIEQNWESVRDTLLIKIDQILARPNLSEKNIAIFTKLNNGLQKPEENFTFSLTSSVQEVAITSEDVEFIFETAANRCSENPCETSENALKIQWEVKNDRIKYIEVNNYRLSSYQGSTWEYNPNVAYNNFSDWENTYVINYLWESEEVLFTENFVINKLVAEVTQVADVVGEVVDDTNNESTSDITTPELVISEPSYSVDTEIPHVDEDEVREYWRGLLNQERTLLGLDDYTYDRNLDNTAKIWSDLAVERGYIDHKVDSPGDSYYDYPKKEAWMKNNGVVCENVSRATFSESIAYNNYYCSDTSKCTDEIKKAVKRTYDFYMSEKGTDYDPHYRAIAHPLFETMWLGLSTVDLWNGGYKMYLTNHYCTTNTL